MNNTKYIDIDPKFKDGIVTVTGWANCPFCDENDMDVGYSCNAIRAKLGFNDYIKFTEKNFVKQNKKTFQPITPDWCPLKETLITVCLENK